MQVPHPWAIALMNIRNHVVYDDQLETKFAQTLEKYSSDTELVCSSKKID